MKVLMLNGSSHINGTTFTALNEIGKALNNEGIDYEIFQIGADAVRDCIGCNQGTPDGGAYTKDNVNEFIAKAKEATELLVNQANTIAFRINEGDSGLDVVILSA